MSEDEQRFRALDAIGAVLSLLRAAAVAASENLLEEADAQKLPHLVEWGTKEIERALEGMQL